MIDNCNSLKANITLFKGRDSDFTVYANMVKITQNTCKNTRMLEYRCSCKSFSSRTILIIYVETIPI